MARWAEGGGAQISDEPQSGERVAKCWCEALAMRLTRDRCRGRLWLERCAGLRAPRSAWREAAFFLGKLASTSERLLTTFCRTLPASSRACHVSLTLVCVPLLALAFPHI